ncbi:MAG: hypothetical protein IT210_12675 [Armatimonadetes bacterium]|nr:hypothetical protein [Armatimonadota bacterium]
MAGWISPSAASGSRNPGVWPGIPWEARPYDGGGHDAIAADLNEDRKLDLVPYDGKTLAWQEDPDTYMMENGLLPMKPPGLKERGVIWVNTGGRKPIFMPVVIQEGRPGWRDVVIGDVDGDGDLDLISKVWNADGPNCHLDFWRNDIKG